MKRLVFRFILLAVSVPMQVLAAAGQAQMHLYCQSLRFQPALTESQGVKYTLDLTTDSPGATQPNGELAPLPDGATSTHGCFYRFSISIFAQPVYGRFALNVPNATDKNTNGIPDFFEISQPVSATTAGHFEDVAQRGDATTAWSRQAGSRNGTCLLTMDGYNLTFTLTFEIQELNGMLNYSPTVTNINGSVQLVKDQNTNQIVSGQAIFEKTSTESLKLNAGSWINPSSQTLVFQEIAELNRVNKDYFAIFEFQDGDRGTAVDDYALWLLKISDPNDSNRNGIPDLSDEPVTRQPSLTLKQSKTNLLLNISGQVGQLHQIERTVILSTSQWTLATSVTLTNDPQVVPLPIPTNAISFWRLRVP
jgi:hypothetical protein